MYFLYMGWCNTKISEIMKNFYKYIFLTAIYFMFSAASMCAEDSIAQPNVLTRYRFSRLPSVSTNLKVFTNPALTAFRQPFSLSSAGLVFQRDKRSSQLSAFESEGSGFGKFAADAYIHHGSSLLYGNAYYSNGIIFNLQWNEMGDYQESLPYVVADAQGGNLRMERYSFAGGYSEFRSKISWGVYGGYDAILSYRQVDPRPKTLTGTLSLSGGIGYNINNRYLAAVSLNFNKFRQTTDISFVSEIGHAKLYHLTGLGTHYNRFAGTGTNVYNDRSKFNASLDLYPLSDNGLFLSLSGTSSSASHIIVDLNRLPLATLKCLGFSSDIGLRKTFSSLSFGTHYSLIYEHHTGTENIFGDAVSMSYPKIAELDMFSEQRFDVSCHAYLENRNSTFLPSVNFTAGYSSHRQEYKEPHRFYTAENINLKLQLAASRHFANRWLVSFTLGGYAKIIVNHNLLFSEPETSDAEIIALEQATISTILAEQSDATGIFINPSILFSISNRHALLLNINAFYESLRCFGKNASISSSISFIF